MTIDPRNKIIVGACLCAVLVGVFVLGRCTAGNDSGATLERVDKLGAKITSLESSIAGQLGSIEKSSGELTKRLDELGAGQGRIAEGLGKLASRLQGFGAKLDWLAVGIDGAQGIVDSDTASLERLYEYLKQLEAELSSPNP